MKTLTLISGIIAVLTVIDHLTLGYKNFYKPIANAEMENIMLKAFAKSLYLMIAVFMIIASSTLIYISSMSKILNVATNPIIAIFAYSYLLMSIMQIIAIASIKSKMAFIKIYQWIPMLIVGVCTLIVSW